MAPAPNTNHVQSDKRLSLVSDPDGQQKPEEEPAEDHSKTSGYDLQPTSEEHKTLSEVSDEEQEALSDEEQEYLSDEEYETASDVSDEEYETGSDVSDEEFSDEGPIIVQGMGVLTHLESENGTLTTSGGKKVVFKATDIIDPAITNLRDVLHEGFTLQYVAEELEDDPTLLVARRISPVHGKNSSDYFQEEKEIDMHSEYLPYNKDLETEAYKTIFGAFLKHKERKIPVSYVIDYLDEHCDNEKVLKYIGETPEERREFLKVRWHIFNLNDADETVKVQHPQIYSSAVKLSAFLLLHGGCTSCTDLYYRYVDLVHVNTTDIYSHNSHFNIFLTGNKFLFKVFPAGNFVSARYNLPELDYMSYAGDFFPEMKRYYETEELDHLIAEEKIRRKTGRGEVNPRLLELSKKRGFSMKRKPAEPFGDPEEVEVTQETEELVMKMMSPEAVVPEFGTFLELTDDAETLDAVCSALMTKTFESPYYKTVQIEKFSDPQ